MASNGSTMWSSVGKKVITGLTGFALIGFVLVHLIGNLTLFIGPHAFNEYAHFLETAVHGGLIYGFEIFIFVVFLFHMVSAMTVAWTDKRKARDSGYKYAKDAGGKSRKTFASKTMVYTGPVILFFVIAHIFLFKFNAGNPHTTDADGVKDLYQVVVLAFKGVGFSIFTVVTMILLGLHLRHGFWSAFQSLGLANDKYLPLLVNSSRVIAIVLAIGFIAIPIYLFLSGDPDALQNMPGGH